MKTLKRILFYPLAFIRLLLVLIGTACISFTGWVWLQFFGFSRKLQNWVLRNWGKLIVVVCGIKIHRNELPPADNFILMPNHRSYLDIFIFSSLTPASFVGKAELRNWPFGKVATKIANLILVDRNNVRSLISTMGAIKNSISQGIPVTIFPEGTTYYGPLTKNFKTGSFKIAADAAIPIIPAAIEYRDKNDAWVGDDTFVPHFFRQMGKPCTHVTIRYSETLIDSDHDKLRIATREKIDRMLSEIQIT